MVDLHYGVVGCLHIVLYWLQDVVDFGWEGTALYPDYAVCLEKLHEFVGLYCGRHDNYLKYT